MAQLKKYQPPEYPGTTIEYEEYKPYENPKAPRFRASEGKAGIPIATRPEQAEDIREFETKLAELEALRNKRGETLRRIRARAIQILVANKIPSQKNRRRRYKTL